MIHPMEAPVFGEVKPVDQSTWGRKRQRRHSWSAADEGAETTGSVAKPAQISAEMASVLWGETFRAMSERVLPTKTVDDALQALADGVADGLSLESDAPNDPSRRLSGNVKQISSRRLSGNVKQISLKLVEAHMTNKSADRICACIGHQQKSGGDRRPVVEQQALLLRQDETYDLVLTFDRDVNPELDLIEIVLESEDRLITIPGFNLVPFLVMASAPDASTSAYKRWWASFVKIGQKKATVRVHVSYSARVGKWRMKVLTGIKPAERSKKREWDMAVAFHRLHIAMNPSRIGKRNSLEETFRRFSKASFSSKEA